MTTTDIALITKLDRRFIQMGEKIVAALPGSDWKFVAHFDGDGVCQATGLKIKHGVCAINLATGETKLVGRGVAKKYLGMVLPRKIAVKSGALMILDIVDVIAAPVVENPCPTCGVALSKKDMITLKIVTTKGQKFHGCAECRTAK